MGNGCISIPSHRKLSGAFAGGGLTINFVGRVERRTGELFHHTLHYDLEVTELMLIRKGRGRFMFDGKHYTAREGDLLIYTPGLWHEEISETDEPFRTIFLCCSGLQVAGLPAGYLIARNRSPIVSLGDRYFGIEQRFSEIYRVVEEDGHESNYIASQLTGALIGEILAVLAGSERRPGKSNEQPSMLVARVRRYIHENYAQRLTLADFTALTHTSPSHLCRVFRLHTSYSPIEYLINYRMEAAKMYLRTTDHKIAVIANLVGYQSETQFQAVFRKTVGSTPGRYRVSCEGPV